MLTGDEHYKLSSNYKVISSAPIPARLVLKPLPLNYKQQHAKMEITIEYWNALAKQTILISSLLSGFSITVVANLIVSNKNDILINRILKSATLSAGCFLVTVFAMVHIAMMTTPGYPLDVVEKDFSLPRIIGSLTFMLGLLSLTAMISLSGWTKSKKLGRYTTAIGILTLILIFSTLIRVTA